MRLRPRPDSRHPAHVRYFDHNATHPLSPAAKVAWLDAIDRFPANPSSPHRWGARAAKAIEDARERVAIWLGCSPAEIVWTSGATESNNAALAHLARNLQAALLVSSVEHPSVRMPALRHFQGRCRFIPVDRSGRVDPGWIQRGLSTGSIAAVAVMAANNETGVLQPWAEIAALCREASIPYLCDAAQWVGKMPAKGLGDCDLVAACAHKFGGPQGIGFLKCPITLQPLLMGGPQEEGRRAGTENVAGILAMVAALEERQAALQADSRTPAPGSQGWKVREEVRDAFARELKRVLPGMEIVGEPADRLWNTVAVLMPPAADCRRRWVVKLDRLGVAVSTGSACASGKEQPSHVLSAMGYRPDESDRMLRFSAGWETTPEDWRELRHALVAAAHDLGVPTVDTNGSRDASSPLNPCARPAAPGPVAETVPYETVSTTADRISPSPQEQTSTSPDSRACGDR